MLSDKKLQKLKNQYYSKLQEIGLSHKWKEAIQLIYSDPTKGEFTNWMLNQLKSGYSIEDIIPTVEYLHKNRKLFSEQDINKYENLKKLEDEVKNIESKKSQNIEYKVQESERTPIWENNEYLLVRINSKNASQKYGKGTKWCITMSDVQYYEQYKANNILFYFLLPKSENGEKFAFSINRDIDNGISGIETFNAKDNPIDENKVPYYSEFSQQMLLDAEKQPKDILPKLVDGNASKEEFIQFVKIYINQYHEAIKSKDINKIKNAIEQLKQLRDYLEQYPNALLFIANKYPEVLYAIKLSESSSEIINEVYNKNLGNDKNLSDYINKEISINYNTPQEILSELSNNTSMVIKEKLSLNPNSSSELLRKLYYIGNALTRENLTINPNTPPDILREIYNKTNSDEVKSYISINPNTPLDILEELAKSNNIGIKKSLIKNPNITIEILLQISSDNRLLADIAKSPKATPEMLERLSHYNDFFIIFNVARNPNTPIDVLDRLSNDSSSKTRDALIDNPNIPIYILEKLVNDSNLEIARQAIEKLKSLNILTEKIEKEEEKPLPFVEKYYKKLPNFPILPKERDEVLEIAKNPKISKEVIDQLIQLEDKEVNDILLNNPGVFEDIKQKIRSESYINKYVDEYVEATNIFTNILKFAECYYFTNFSNSSDA